MKIVIQRVSEASVKVNNEITGEISKGLLLLVGVEEEDSQEDSSVKNSKQIVQIAILSILAAPLAIPLLILALTLVFTFFLLISVFAFVMAVFAFAMFAIGASLIWDSLTLGMGTSIPAFALSLGMSLLALGMAGLFYLSTGPILRFIKLSFVKLAQALARKGGRHV